MPVVTADGVRQIVRLGSTPTGRQIVPFFRQVRVAFQFFCHSWRDVRESFLTHLRIVPCRLLSGAVRIYPAFHDREIAAIRGVQFGRRPPRCAVAHPRLGTAMHRGVRRDRSGRPSRRAPVLSTHNTPSSTGRRGVHGLPRLSARRGGSGIGGAGRARRASVRSMPRAPPRAQPATCVMASVRAGGAHATSRTPVRNIFTN